MVVTTTLSPVLKLFQDNSLISKWEKGKREEETVIHHFVEQSNTLHYIG